ncbi:hypothetical protein AB0O80_10585 [Rothia kristinae]|uniref:hypothetical protein n=1 Tax=Actinomycetes TaxID=1760 RepID=UPI0034289169
MSALAAFGITASTIVSADRGPGTIRISRTGGDLEAQRMRDNPRILVEVWEESPPAAFDRAVQVYAAFQVFNERGTILPGVAVHDMDLQSPRSYDDPLAPGLARVQFVADYLTDLTTISLKEDAHGGE